MGFSYSVDAAVDWLALDFRPCTTTFDVPASKVFFLPRVFRLAALLDSTLLDSTKNDFLVDVLPNRIFLRDTDLRTEAGRRSGTISAVPPAPLPSSSVVSAFDSPLSTLDGGTVTAARLLFVPGISTMRSERSFRVPPMPPSSSSSAMLPLFSTLPPVLVA